ncbi:MAG: hypothetical protein KAT28_05545 [Candidatus Aenigmarchaeota archaeon]|nr:hypothetical protein [Candidatus Aenigmarchaeota archaeon]
MVRDDYQETVLNYGRTDGENLPGMPKGIGFSVGYNSRYGLVDVLVSGDVSFFEGRVNIEKLLSEYQSADKKEVNSQVEGFIMEAYNNLGDYQNNPEKHINPPTPILEVLSYKG